MLIIPINLNKEIFNLVTALQAQLDGIKDIIMKTLGKGKQKGSSKNVEDNPGRSQEKSTGSSKNIEYAQEGTSKGKGKFSSSRNVSKSKEPKIILYLDTDSDDLEEIRGRMLEEEVEKERERMLEEEVEK